MTPQDVDLVQSTFEKVRPISLAAAGMFYDRLFEIAPEVRPLFKGDMAEQGRKLMATLAVVVGSLHSLPTILPAVSTLAKTSLVASSAALASPSRPKQYQ